MEYDLAIPVECAIPLDPQVQGVIMGVPHRLLMVLRKYIALVGKIPCPLLLGGWFCRGAGSGKLICRVISEFSSGKNHPPVVVSYCRRCLTCGSLLTFTQPYTLYAGGGGQWPPKCRQSIDNNRQCLMYDFEHSTIKRRLLIARSWKCWNIQPSRTKIDDLTTFNRCFKCLLQVGSEVWCKYSLYFCEYVQPFPTRRNFRPHSSRRNPSGKSD